MNGKSWIILGVSGVTGLSAQAEEGCGHSSSDRFHPLVVYQQACSRCHEAPQANRHSDAEWRHVLETMVRRAELDDTDRQAVAELLELMN